MNIYVGNLAPDVSEEDLKTAFSAFGQVQTATVIKDKFSGESRGFASDSDFGLRTSEVEFGHGSLAASPGDLKGVVGNLVPSRLLPVLAPLGTVLDDPIRQCALESNVATGLFGFNPLVLQNLLAFRLEFPVERRVLQQITCRGRLFRFVRHNREYKLLRAQKSTRVTARGNPYLRLSAASRPLAVPLAPSLPSLSFWSNIAHQTASANAVRQAADAGSRQS